MKARQKLFQDTVRVDNIDEKDVYRLSYHGGIPNIPYSQKLYIALTNEYILFFNDKGDKDRIYFNNCYKIEEIVTRHDPDLKGKSLVLWGPLVGFFMKVKFRYYIVVDYNDSINNQNNILLECEANVHKALYANMNERYQNIRKASKARIE